MIDGTINEDITYQSQPLDLRNQRTYAIKVGNTHSDISQGLLIGESSLG